MENAHLPDSWHDLYVMLGTSSAALIGLLFVATSLHLDQIIKNPVYATRSRHNTYILVFTLIESIIVLTPQPINWAGVELVVTNLGLLWLPVRNVYNFLIKSPESGRTGGWSIYRALTFIASFLLGILGGILLIGRATAGLYAITLAYAMLLTNIALNAWRILIGIGQLDEAAKQNRQEQSGSN